jgi:hypothetical protein
VNQKAVVGFFREDGKTKPITKSRSLLNRKKIIVNSKSLKPVKPFKDKTYLQQLKVGTKVEMEHTKDPQVARKIAADHLAESPCYYKYLLQMEKTMKSEGCTSTWSLAYKRNRQLKDITKHFLEKFNIKCFFCKKRILPKELPDNITEHHKNGNHNDNRPANKALAHETCHRKYHYAEVAPRNGTTKDYGQWCTPKERIVHKDQDFFVVRHPARTKTGFCFEVVPVTLKGGRMDDWEICPEPDNLGEALKLAAKHRAEVRKYKRNHVADGLVE